MRVRVEKKRKRKEEEGGGGGGLEGGLAARWRRVECAAAVEVTTYCCLRPRKALRSTLRMGQQLLGRSGAERMDAVRLLGCAREYSPYTRRRQLAMGRIAGPLDLGTQCREASYKRSRRRSVEIW